MHVKSQAAAVPGLREAENTSAKDVITPPGLGERAASLSEQN